jgi:hypothetical protein
MLLRYPPDAAAAGAALGVRVRLGDLRLARIRRSRESNTSIA